VFRLSIKRWSSAGCPCHAIVVPSIKALIQAVILNFLQVFGIVLTMGMSALMKHGMLAANLCLCTTLLLGTVATGISQPVSQSGNQSVL